MKVTEKCDVYSFGVLALEVVMGKHPGELLSVLPIEGDKLSLMDVLDPRLQPPNGPISQELALVVSQAFACTGTDPMSRPTMHQVSSVLSKGNSAPSLDPLDTLTLQKLMYARK